MRTNGEIVNYKEMIVEKSILLRPDLDFISDVFALLLRLEKKMIIL